ncbi:MAG: serine/threonine protein kinase [Polyangiaceae bacterium]|nr:serine/threonine protein kinase [Polyangiaceae bacterium]
MNPGPPGAPQRLGDYEIVQWLATGGMAEVYVARRKGARGFSKLVALKRILPQYAADAEFVAMFTDEARICSGLTHPNLVEVFDFGEENGELFMAMELVDGTNCARLVRAAATRGEAVPVEDALFIALNVLRGLEYAHEAEAEDGTPLGLVHRDVSPGNVLLSRTGAVKLADFGIMRAIHSERRTDTGQLKGKLGYMSPEQVLGREVDPRSDLFTLGIVLAELLTGRPLFSYGAELDILQRIRDANIGTFERYGGALPAELRDVVRKALARDPQDRYPHAGAFAEAIESLALRLRLTLGPVRLSAYVEALGLVRQASRSGEFRFRGVLDATPRAKPVQRPAPPLPEENPATYAVRLPDGTALDPLPLARVLEGLITGRIPPEADVARNGGPFLKPREHPELRRLASRSSSRWNFTVSPQGGEPLRFDARTLATHLFRLAASLTTGTVLAIQGEERKKLHLKEGRVTLVTSTNPDELLGERLRRQGKILPIELDMALALAPRHGGRVGDALVGLNILRPLELFEALFSQTCDRTAALLQWTEGELWLLPAENHEEDGIPWGHSALELITQGILQHTTQEALERHLEALHATALHPGPRSAPCPHALRLPAGPAAVMLAVDGARPLAQFFEDLRGQGFTRLQVLQGVFVGLSCGAIEAEGWNA